MRAYRQRVRSLKHGWQSLRALNVLEQPIETLLASARYYGMDALTRAQAVSVGAAGENAAAAAFVITALEQVAGPANQSAGSAWIALYQAHPHPVRDALWFHGPSSLCETLLAQTTPALQHLGVELAGRMTQQHLASQIAKISVPASDKLQALGLLDACGREIPAEILAWLEHGDSPGSLHTALSFLLVTGIAAPQPALQAALDASLKSVHAQTPWATDNLDAACALTCIHQTPQAAGQALAAASLPDDIRLRCVAFLGTPNLLLQAFADIDRQNVPLTREQKNLILTTLGQLPAELTEQPGEPAARGQALRALAASVFRANGCADITADQLAGWPPDLLTGPLWPLEQIRLRAGKPWNNKLNCELMLETSHRMRRWLYAEHAAVTGRSFPLAADDRASRQMQVLQTLEGLDELFDLQ